MNEGGGATVGKEMREVGWVEIGVGQYDLQG